MYFMNKVFSCVWTLIWFLLNISNSSRFIVYVEETRLELIRYLHHKEISYYNFQPQLALHSLWFFYLSEAIQCNF